MNKRFVHGVSCTEELVDVMLLELSVHLIVVHSVSEGIVSFYDAYGHQSI